MWRGLTLLEAGHIDDARECFDRARQLDPLSGIHYGWLGATEAIEGNPQAAEELLLRAHRLGWRGPASAWLLKLALNRHGFGEQAQSAFDNWLHDDERIDESARSIYRELTPAMADPDLRPAAADRLGAAIADMPDKDWTNLLLFLGLHEAAVEEAHRPKPPSGQIVLMMIWTPFDKPFREHPDFMRIAEDAGLLAFWRQHGWPDHCRMGNEALECSR